MLQRTLAAFVAAIAATIGIPVALAAVSVTITAAI
jgi:hypothetical protein